jgi:hypothetical protein
LTERGNQERQRKKAPEDILNLLGVFISDSSGKSIL